MPPAASVRPERADGQITGLAGEFFVAAELLRRGLQTSVTFGNAKSIDLFAYHPKSGRSFNVQVKAIRKRNAFPIAHKKVVASHIYVFVILNKPGETPTYYVVPGTDLSSDPAKFTHWFTDPKFPGINWKTLADLGYEDGWHVFDSSEA